MENKERIQHIADKKEEEKDNISVLFGGDFEIPEPVDVSKLSPEEIEELFPAGGEIEKLIYISPFELDNLNPDIPLSEQLGAIDNSFYGDKPEQDDSDIWAMIENEGIQEKMTLSFQNAMEACQSQDVTTELMLFLELIRLNFNLDCYINYALQIVKTATIPLSTCRYLNSKTIDTLEKLGNATIVVDNRVMYITPVLDGLKEKAYYLQEAITAYCRKYHNYSLT